MSQMAAAAFFHEDWAVVIWEFLGWRHKARMPFNPNRSLVFMSDLVFVPSRSVTSLAKA